ncbi:DUF2937 family protein [Pseudoalteromonas sp. Cnat2-41]|uniref:DUF2937 family protein n=1 Tax=unclassified Pseudoalteromonas TaxID=194690 RepID=UPI001EF8609E|nr:MULTISPECIES: DUF2937 family protein [unclassified Pseudoalteromonas]MCF2861478.1 DUF2937 family protein [Pseudoalteromonas sp. CNAT2-18]MCG7557483.1 DUF2937 family protein [Pseudoalteromonas sp. CNAT2-18.1]
MLKDIIRWCRHYVRLCVFFIAALLGLQVPGFVDDYGHALRASNDEVTQAIAPFKDDAKQFFNGSLEKLLAHYQQSDDRIYAKGGDNLALLLERQEQLENAVADYQSNPYWHLLTAPVIDVGQSVWQSYRPQIQLNMASLGSALVVALMITWCVEGLFILLTSALLAVLSLFINVRSTSS